MLARNNRLLKRKSFNYIYKKGRHVGGDLVTLVFVYARRSPTPHSPAIAGPEARPPSAPPVRIGFSVSKKVGNSVVRHRVTRQMRAAAYQLLQRIAPHHDLIFVAKEGIFGKPTAEIQKAMETALSKAKLI